MQTLQIPPATITGIGSLPHHDPVAAVQFAAQMCPTLPFWPELPQRTPDERSVERVCRPFLDLLHPHPLGSGYTVRRGQLPTLLERLMHGPAQLDPTNAAGLFAFLAALKAGQLPHAVALKGQLVGPLTLGWQIWDADTPLIVYPAAQGALAHYIFRLARWQLAQLQCFDKPILLFLDEPCLALAPPQTALGIALIRTLRSLIVALRQPHVFVGVHTCATEPHGSPLTALYQVQPDIVSFDAHHDLETCMAMPATKAFLDAGGWLAAGLIPTWQQLAACDVNELLLRWLVAAPDTIAVPTLARQTLITATCGLGLLSETAATDSFHLAQHLAERIAAVATNTNSLGI